MVVAEQRHDEIEHIEWMDAESSNGWHSNDNDYEVCICHSIGFVVHETDDLLVIAQTVSGGLHNNRSKIPKVCILKRQKMIAVKAQYCPELEPSREETGHQGQRQDGQPDQELEVSQNRPLDAHSSV